jgi:hypothetical protein
MTMGVCIGGGIGGGIGARGWFGWRVGSMEVRAWMCGLMKEMADQAVGVFSTVETRNRGGGGGGSGFDSRLGLQ